MGGQFRLSSYCEISGGRLRLQNYLVSQVGGTKETILKPLITAGYWQEKE